MGRQVLSKFEVNKIKRLRETGHSLIEIKNIVHRGYGTVFRYIKNIPILPRYQEIWKIKRGGSKSKSIKEWQIARSEASKIITPFNFKEKMIILSCLYWGEGNKTELGVINSDPFLIRSVIICLKKLGIKEDEIKIGLRLFEDINKSEAIDFWTKTLNLQRINIQSFEIIKGKKIGKLRYGMCRLRVKKGGKHFKLIMSMIDLIRSRI